MGSKNQNIADFYPLSPMQQGILFHTLYAPFSGVYCEQLSCTLQGKFDIGLFQRTWQEIIARHPILRTAFVWEGLKEPIQVVYHQVQLPWEQYDWRGLTEVEQQSQLEELLESDRQQSFELSKPPLMRLVIIQLTQDSYQFIWSHHHLLLDGWSTSLLLQEIFTIYQGLSCSNTKSLPNSQLSTFNSPRPYRDYIVWLQQQNRSEAELFWREKLKGFTAPTPLIGRKASSSCNSSKIQQIELSSEITADLRSQARQHQLTLNTLVQGAWAILLSRYSGENDIVFGTTVSGRPPNLTGADTMVGLFINTLPVRIKITEDLLLTWLQTLQAQQVESQQYEYSPLIDIQQNSELSPGVSLFESLLVFENYPTFKVENGGLEIKSDRASERTNYPLTVLAAVDEVLSLKISYNSDRFDDDAIARMLRHLQTLLQAITINPKVKLSDLPLLTPKEQQEILVEWNNTNRNYPQNQCIHQLFEAQVEYTPDAVAVIWGEEQFTYQQLNQQANKIADYLRSLGVGAEVLVGVCLERSLNLIVALLGILKAGGAYLPLDPAYPSERLTFIVQDAEATIVLTDSNLVSKLPLNSTKIICLDTDKYTNNTQSQANISSTVTTDNLAYVIYTSGSTGIPKGVAIEHSSSVTLLHWAKEVFTSAELAGVLAATSICFDLSVFELFVPLSWGGTVILAENILALAQLPAADKVTLINTVPSAIAALLQTNSIPASVRTINLAGEALSPQLVQQLYEDSNIERVVNLYGPSEDTTYSTYTIVEPGAEVVTIGKPIANTQIYILDANQKPVPVGVTGEIYIGGAKLARGYLNRTELTAQKFINNQFNSDSRLYKTGDLGRYLADGNIEFLGRIDHQVKIRGFRIELTEIETILSQYPAVNQVVVIAREDQPGEKRLIAYVVTNQTVSINELREFLTTKLPDYMIPSAFMLLESLPLTPNGKIDRLALPQPEPERLLAQAFKSSRNFVEEMLVGIWSQVLNLKEVGIHDNFFELGGHSLLATQIIQRSRQALKIDLPLRCLFESPTIAKLAQTIETLRQQENHLDFPLQSAERNQQLPLSFAQQRLWFFEQLEGGTTYHLSVAVRLLGEIHLTALEQSLNQIVKRHEILRTNFVVVDNQPVQVINPSLELKLSFLEVSDCPFDLSQEPLVRVNLLQQSKNESLMLLTMHHLIADGWSMGVFLQELATLYAAYSTGQSPQLPELPIQYADFALWQKQYLQGEVLATQLNYWKQQLKGELPVLDLPCDRPRPAIQTYTGKKYSFLLPKTLTDALKTLSQQQGVTLFMTLLAAFQILLYRYTKQSDILIGSPIANRNRSEIEPLIGCFANTLVLRINLSGNPTFKQLLERVREVAMGAYHHQDLPFEKLVEELQPQRNLSYNPLFQVLFALHNVPMPSLELSGITLSLEEMENQTARFDLALDMWEESGGIKGIFEYNQDLFDQSTVCRMAGHLQIILESAIASPDQSISTLPLLTSTEQQQLLVDWNNTQTNYTSDRCLHELFEVQVEKNPDAVVVFADQQLTYQELNQQANKIANYLRKLGVGAEVPVGICVDRSVQMIVGLLAILKAGGAYVPLDPVHPRDRLISIVQDAQIEIILTQSHLLEFAFPVKQVICLDSDWHQISQECNENLDSITPENLAYVIYTSGSTGKPKGVQISHRSIVHLLVTTCPQFNFNQHDVWTVVHSYAFDFSVWEIWGALVCGSKLVVVERDLVRSPADFYNLLRQEQVTILHQTPTALCQLIEFPINDLNLRLIICGGEALPQALIPQLLALNVPVWNFYGPTEATVWSAMNLITGVDSEKIAIGRPLANTQFYILDTNLQPVPIGVSGELHIGGISLARGYLNRPQLTAEKFIPHPFKHQPGERLYKTGDLARYLPDGTIQFLGRIDNQVKIRGFRIELGEIETVLTQSPQVKQAVVLVREHYLCAYIVPAQQELQLSDLRCYLKQQLPDYMIPDRFVFLEALPVTANGKLDRSLLPAPDSAQLSESTPARVQTPVAEIIQEIWQQILGIKLGIHDNFFDLGGHSLLATQVISRLRTVLQIDLPLVYLFTAPTIAQLAATIETMLRKQQGLEIPPIAKINRSPQLTSDFSNSATCASEALASPRASFQLATFSLPLSFGQYRLWFLNQLEPNSAIYNIPIAVKLTGALNVAVLEQSFREVVRRHEVLQTRFISIAGEPQLVIDNADLTLTVVNLEELSGDRQAAEVQSLATHEALQPFDLNHSPLLRVMLLRLDQTNYVLLLTMHHIVSDGWSMGILIQELAALYTAFKDNKPSPLPDLPIQYADFAAWQRQLLKGEVLERQLTYWKQQLAGANTLIPTDNPRPSVQTFRGKAHSLTLSPTLTAALQALSQQAGVTLFMTLLTAYKVLLSCYSQQSDILVGTPIANRTQTETEKLIGFFINTLVLRTDLSGNPTISELLKRVRQVAIGAYLHQDLPFEKLVEELKIERHQSYSPLFQVWFVLHNTPIPSLDLPDLSLTPLDLPSHTVKFDLMLSMWETAEGLNACFEYNADLFEETTITRMSEHFMTLLDKIVAQPEIKLGALFASLTATNITEVETANLHRLKNIKRKPLSSFKS